MDFANSFGNIDIYLRFTGKFNEGDKMQNSEQAMCPLFPDMECPRGHSSAEACQVRMNSDYDPMTDFRDYLFMNCAIHRARQENDKNKDQ